MKKINQNLISDLSLIPVILSGGSGSRLWPLSRESHPKQYLMLDERNNFTLLQNTYLRLTGLKYLQVPIIISHERQRFILAEQMRRINVNPSSILLEPTGRNTGPAITLAALKALENYKDPLLLVLSSDHKIEDEEQFREVIKTGISEAIKGRIVSFGVIPNRPDTGFGYIECFEEMKFGNTVSGIKKFIEKPNLELANKLIKNKNYLWNSGIFLFKASTFLKELKKFEPKIIEICNQSLKKGIQDLDFFRINKMIFKECPNIPIDIALMERTKLGTVVSLDVGWDDIGSWESVWKNSIKDKNGNAIKGKVIIDDSTNCYLRSEERLIVGINLNNLIVIETNDAILVSDKNATQKVKKTVQLMNNKNYEEGKNNKKDYRPWGSFTSIEKGSSWQVKRLEINPQSSISLQKHHHRSEHWIIVKGTAKVEINGEISFLKSNESTFIPKGTIHRLTNPVDEPLVLIEVQSGSYLGEDDIVRFEDNYGRKIIRENN